MRLPVLLLTAIVSTTAAASANWPSWRGPAGDGVSGETNLPVKWGPTQNIAWKLELPQWSGATPIISDGYGPSGKVGKIKVQARAEKKPADEFASPGFCFIMSKLSDFDD